MEGFSVVSNYFMHVFVSCFTFQELVYVVLEIILSLHIIQIALSIRETIFGDIHWDITIVTLDELHQPPYPPWCNL